MRTRQTLGLVRVMALCSGLVGVGLSLQGAETPAPPTKPWEASISAGLTYTKGNTETVLFTLGGNFRRKWNKDEIFVKSAFGYGQTKNPFTDQRTKSADFVQGDFQWNHLFTRKLYAGLSLAALHDAVADIAYRFIVSPLLGYYFIRTDTDLLNAELGPGFVFQQQGGVVNNYVAVRISQRYEHKFATKARVWEAVSYLPAVDEWVENYIINAEVGAEAFLTKAVSLRLVATDIYTSRPAPGARENDFKLIAGVGYTF